MSTLFHSVYVANNGVGSISSKGYEKYCYKIAVTRTLLCYGITGYGGSVYSESLYEGGNIWIKENTNYLTGTYSINTMNCNDGIKSYTWIPSPSLNIVSCGINGSDVWYK